MACVRNFLITTTRTCCTPLQILLKDGLQVNHVRLFVGTSMGCMEGFMWSEAKPGDVDAYMLLSCLAGASRGTQSHGTQNHDRRCA